MIAPIRILIAAGACALGVACSHGQAVSYPLATSAEAPAARGTVQIEPTRDGDTKVEINAAHLTPPQQLNPPAATYVAWVQSFEPGAPTQRLGELELNKDYAAHLDATTPLKDFVLFVTPEFAAGVEAPTREVVMESRVTHARTGS